MPTIETIDEISEHNIADNDIVDNDVVDNHVMIESKHNLTGYVQMIMTNYLLPPLPVVACGEDGTRIASSHDMLHMAIACELLASQKNPPNTNDPEFIKKMSRKRDIMNNMHLEIIEAFDQYIQNPAPDPNTFYDIYTRVTREYLSLYPGIDHNVLFKDIDYVAINDVVNQQAISHLIAYNSSMPVSLDIVPASNSYKDLIVAYAKTAWSMRD